MRCQGCGDNKGIQQNGLTLCKKCYDPSSEILRCQSEAMIQYALNKKDLEELDYAVAYNTHSGHYDTKLYLVTDLHDLAVQKWGSDDKLRRVIEERGKRRDEKRDRKMQERRERKRSLQDHLIGLGLEGIRGDSAICADYIENGDNSEWTIDSISEVMLEMEFYYKKTDYGQILRQTRNYYHREWGNFVIEDEIRDEAKRVALLTYVETNYENPG